MLKHINRFLTDICFVVIILAVIEAIVVIVLIFLRSRLCIAIALLKEGSKYVYIDKSFLCLFIKYCVFLHIPFPDIVSRAISCIKSTLFYPVITFFLLAICIAYWAVTAVYPFNCKGKCFFRFLNYVKLLLSSICNGVEAGLKNKIFHVVVMHPHCT